MEPVPRHIHAGYSSGESDHPRYGVPAEDQSSGYPTRASDCTKPVLPAGHEIHWPLHSLLPGKPLQLVLPRGGGARQTVPEHVRQGAGGTGGYLSD
ncbi:hypothetical protein D1872_266450 [compost metagenome]